MASAKLIVYRYLPQYESSYISHYLSLLELLAFVNLKFLEFKTCNNILLHAGKDNIQQHFF
jgi:hypothetical protein